MTPDFALHFSVDGIALDQRTPHGWLRLGHAAFASDRFQADMAELRTNGLAAAEANDITFATKLVLPNDQLKFLSLDGVTATRETVSRALKEATPYALSELAFDWQASSGATHVAAVAKHTLDEAEAFALEHQMAPVAFAALPGAGWLGTEAFFGPSRVADGLNPRRDPLPYIQTTLSEIAKAELDARLEVEIPPDPGPVADPPRTVEAAPTFQTVRHGEVSGAAPALGAPMPAPEPKPAPIDAGAGPLGAAPPPDPPPAPSGTLRATAPSAEALSATLRPVESAFTKELKAVDADAFQGATATGPALEAPRQRGKPRLLGLVLTIILILALLAIAAFAAVNENAIARLFEPEMAAAPDVPAEELLPAPEDAPDVVLAPPPVSITPTPLIPPREVLPDTLAEEGEEAALPETVVVELTQQELERLYAATGIWPQAPPQPRAPRPSELETLYRTSIDRQIAIGDPVALTLAPGFDSDARPPAQPLPPTPEMRFAFDEDGLLIPTEDGAVSPQAYTVFAGRPPIVPPLRVPSSENSLAPGVDLSAVRPRLRPDRLVENAERNAFGGLSIEELAAIRPNLRPETAKAQEEAEESDAPPSALAVASSPRPRTRPSNFDRIVADARASQPSTVAVAAPVAPQVTQPTAPTRASVARAATTENAINLRRVNLIGVYGTPSNRSALVRLANGRFVKVQVGDRVDGGRVAAISESALRYVKGGRNITLEIPTAS